MKAIYATDLSDAMETAIGSRTCLECLQRYGIDEIYLMTVVTPDATPGVPGGDLTDRVRSALESQADDLRAEGFAVETRVMRGTPFRRINGLADRVDADLIVVGSRGESPLERRPIGSTTRNVARTAVRPLLIQRILAAEDEFEVANEHLFERVLFATDFSENAARAYEQFEHLQGATQEALLLHVRSSDQEGAANAPRDAADASDRLESMADDLRPLGVDVRTSVREGEPVDEILAASAEYDPTTVLLGARGLGRIRRLLLGSVSERVAARADSNVLVVPPSRLR